MRSCSAGRSSAHTTSAHCHTGTSTPGTKLRSESAHASRKYGSTAAQLT